MSKKKNTLKELDEFLKQQAAALVSPRKLGLDEPVLKESPIMRETEKEVSAHRVLEDIRELSEKEGEQFRKKFYDMIIRTLESQHDSTPEDKMLINTALYLKNPQNWKETIRAYWRSKSLQ